MPLDGALSISNITTLLTYETRATVLKYLPNINSITITNSPNLPSTDSNIEGTNKSLFRFEYMPNLQVLDITDCTGLTEDIDLSTNTEILQVDARGTSLNVILPTNSKIVSLKLGSPSAIEIDSPTVLDSENVLVDSYANLESLDLVNIPNNKAYAMFGNIVEVLILGGTVTQYRTIKETTGEEVQGNSWNYVTSYIQVAKGATIKVTTPTSTWPYNIFQYNNNKEYIDRSYQYRNEETKTITLNANTKYIRFDAGSSEWNIVDATTGDVYFSYNPN